MRLEPAEAIAANADPMAGLADWRRLQAAYEKRTGYHLVVADVNGAIRMGVPNCDLFPCLKSCRKCREDIIKEALRTGQVCVDTCHEGYCMWGLPFQHEGRIAGGVVVIGGVMAIERERHLFEAACAELYTLMSAHGLLPKPAERQPLPGAVCRFVERKTFNLLVGMMESHGRVLIQAMTTAEFEEARAAYERLRRCFAEAVGMPLDVFRGLMTELVFRARHAFAEAGMDIYACFAEAGAIVREMAEAETVEAIDATLQVFLTRFEWLLSQRQKDADDQLIEKATTYLEEHLREDLDRDQVARAVGLSPSHFSRLLRETKGRTFTDLLSQYRIERACSLLVRTSKTIAEIAGECGFCDQSYFSKVFRRYKGETPARYRDSHRL